MMNPELIAKASAILEEAYQLGFKHGKNLALDEAVKAISNYGNDGRCDCRNINEDYLIEAIKELKE